MLRTKRKKMSAGKRAAVTAVVLGAFAASLFFAVGKPSAPEAQVVEHRVVVVHNYTHSPHVAPPAPQQGQDAGALGAVLVALLVSALFIGGPFLLVYTYHPRLGWITRSSL
jgi:hypothetical protein